MKIEELSDMELLLQLSEEAAELAAATAKMVRKLDGVNPTPKSESECRCCVIEELADVRLCSQLLINRWDKRKGSTVVRPVTDAVKRLMIQKLERWRTRLQEGESDA